MMARHMNDIERRHGRHQRGTSRPATTTATATAAAAPSLPPTAALESSDGVRAGARTASDAPAAAALRHGAGGDDADEAVQALGGGIHTTVAIPVLVLGGGGVKMNL